ncbi:hypothetical protein BDK51DRAFT_33367, partial [Blyttiomyces helicus]
MPSQLTTPTSSAMSLQKTAPPRYPQAEVVIDNREGRPQASTEKEAEEWEVVGQGAGAAGGHIGEGGKGRAGVQRRKIPREGNGAKAKEKPGRERLTDIIPAHPSQQPISWTKDGAVPDDGSVGPSSEEVIINWLAGEKKDVSYFIRWKGDTYG